LPFPEHEIDSFENLLKHFVTEQSFEYQFFMQLQVLILVQLPFPEHTEDSLENLL
jgi:hypothetical protein